MPFPKNTKPKNEKKKPEREISHYENGIAIFVKNLEEKQEAFKVLVISEKCTKKVKCFYCKKPAECTVSYKNLNGINNPIRNQIVKELCNSTKCSWDFIKDDPNYKDLGDIVKFKNDPNCKIFEDIHILRIQLENLEYLQQDQQNNPEEADETQGYINEINDEIERLEQALQI